MKKEIVEINASTLPASIDAERAILGSILLDNKTFNEAAGLINAADFSLDAHRRIFARMTDLAAAAKPIDLITLVEELERRKDLKPIGDVAYVSSLVDGTPERPTIEQYVRIVKEKAQLRAMLLTAKLTIERIVAGDGPTEVAAGLLDAVLDVEAHSTRTRAVTPREFMPDVLRSIQDQAATKGLIGLPTGVSCLDDAIGGLRKGELIVIGARPGAGKTALAGQIAYANCSNNTAVGMFSLEMSRWDLGRRFLSAVTNVPAFKIRDPRYLDQDDPAWMILANGAGEIAGWPLHIDDNGSLTISEMIARAKLFIARHKAELIVIDYLQLIRAENISDIRERVGYVADQLRILAKSEQVPVVLLSQLRRPSNLNDEPTLLDLKESGDIEAHAHIVLLIYSPVGPDMKPTGEQKIIVAKNRNGLRGQEMVTLSDSKLLFYPTAS